MKKHDLTNTHLHRKSPGKALYAAFVGVTMAAMLCQPVFAATVWEKANEIMKDVYNQILLISIHCGRCHGVHRAADDEFFQER